MGRSVPPHFSAVKWMILDDFVDFFGAQLNALLLEKYRVELHVSEDNNVLNFFSQVKG